MAAGPEVADGSAAALRQAMDERRVGGVLGAPRGPFALVADDAPDLRWRIDPASRSVHQGDGEVEEVILGGAADLLRMLDGSENLGVLL